MGDSLKGSLRAHAGWAGSGGRNARARAARCAGSGSGSRLQLRGLRLRAGLGLSHGWLRHPAVLRLSSRLTFGSGVKLVRWGARRGPTVADDPLELTMTVQLRWLQVELQDPDGVALGVLEPRGRPAANIRDAVDGLQPRKVVLLEDDAT
jgi:hypothetical protein